MALKKFKPMTAGTRFKVANTYAEVTTDTPEKSLLTSIKKSGGRNNQGRRSMRYIGGGHKRQYRIIDFKRNKHAQVLIVAQSSLSKMEEVFTK